MDTVSVASAADTSPSTQRGHLGPTGRSLQLSVFPRIFWSRPERLIMKFGRGRGPADFLTIVKIVQHHHRSENSSSSPAEVCHFLIRQAMIWRTCAKVRSNLKPSNGMPIFYVAVTHAQRVKAAAASSYSEYAPRVGACDGLLLTLPSFRRSSDWSPLSVATQIRPFDCGPQEVLVKRLTRCWKQRPTGQMICTAVAPQDQTHA